MNRLRRRAFGPLLSALAFARVLAAQEPLPPAPPPPPEAPASPPPSAPSEAPPVPPAPPASDAPPDAAPPPPVTPAAEAPATLPPAPAPPPPVPPGATVDVDREPASPSPAPQKPPPATSHRLFFEAAVGGGVLSATSGSESDRRSFTSPAVSFHVLVGGSLQRGWALGAGYSRDHMPSIRARDEVIDGDEPNVSDLTFSTTSFTVFADWHPGQGDGFHAQAHLGLGWLNIDRINGSSRSSELDWDFILGAGYDVRLTEHMTMGGLAQVTWLVVQASESGSTTDVNLFVPSLLLTVAYR